LIESSKATSDQRVAQLSFDCVALLSHMTISDDHLVNPALQFYSLHPPSITPPGVLTMSTHEEETIIHQLPQFDPTRPHSFDLTLELERQLDAESLSSSPAGPDGRPQSLDTHVLASLVTSLRLNVSELTKERDGLSASLEAARSREAVLATEVRQLQDAQVERDTQLEILRQKIRDDEESIMLLRSKVEESR
jgi:hypothetical protein